MGIFSPNVSIFS